MWITDQDVHQAMNEANPFLAFVLSVSYLFLITFIVLSIVIAIVDLAFTEARESTHVNRLLGNEDRTSV